MRGTSYTIGFGVAILFVAGGIALLALGDDLFPPGSPEEDVGGAGDVVRIIGAIWVGVAVLLLGLFAVLRIRDSRRARIAASGDPGTATVIAAKQTGVFVNQNPQFKLTLDLASDALLSGRRVERRAVVPLTALGRFGVGTELPIRISREKPDDFEVIWDELPVPGSERAGRTDAEQRIAVLERLRREGTISAAEYESKRKQILAEL